MSPITRCPACQTMFKVDPDQLRASGGWARCGQCQEAFDAAAHLVSSSDIGALDAAPPMPQTEAVDAALPPEPNPGAEASAAFFVDAARAASPRQPLWVRTSLLLTALLLTGGLVLQVLVQERDPLAAYAPGLRPLLEDACAFMRCTIAPPRQIESVVIDSSSFNKLQPDVYRLSFTLRSTAPIDLALPAIELTLTDSQDQAILRRVFRPEEFQPASPELAAGGEFTGALTLDIHYPDGNDRLAGYRLLAFYL